jgi:hypothetical protein
LLDRESNHSINLQAVVDPDGRVRWWFFGPPGPQHDSTGETQTQVDVGVREGCLRELLDVRCAKRRALQWRSQKLLAGARVEFSFALKSRFCHRELLWFWKWNF